MAKVAQWKIEKVEQLKRKTVDSAVVGVVNMHKLPARQLQHIRKNMLGQVDIQMARNTILGLALQKAAKEGKRGIDNLTAHLDGPCALIFTDINPFQLYATIEETRTPAPAKGGDVAPRDIVVSKGKTLFPPGPIIGELQQAGIPARIEGSAVVISEDRVVAKKGEKISQQLANALKRLDIKPVEVGLNIQAVYEDGVIFTPETLAINREVVETQINSAYQAAFNLALNTNIFTSRTVPVLLQQAHQDAYNLTLSVGIPTVETAEDLVVQVEMQARNLAMRIANRNPNALDKDLQQTIFESVSEEKRKEEKPEKEEEKEKVEEKEESEE